MNKFDYTQIPDHMMTSLVAYKDKRQPAGHFLTAVLEGDLHTACSRADDTNMWLLPVYSMFLYNEMPIGCWGSREKVYWLLGFQGEGDDE